MRKWLSVAAIVAVPLTWPLAAPGETLRAFVGSASKPAMTQAAAAFEEETGIDVELHFGGSGSMLSEMILSKRGDVYCPGSPDYMQLAIEKGAVDPQTVRIVCYLVPAINVAAGNPKGIRRLEDLGREGVRVAIANPHSVCVGLYAVEVIEASGLKDSIKPNIKGYMESCAKTANIVALGNVDAVIGWRVFQYWNPDRIETVLLEPQQLPRLAYIPVAVSSTCEDRQSAQRFIDFLASEHGQSIFAKWGYIATEAEARKYAPNAAIGEAYELPEGW